MTERERFIETLLFGKPDKIPLMPGGPRESTLKRWHQEGLPPGCDWYAFLLKELGITKETGQTPISLDVSFKMMPEFEEKTAISLPATTGFLLMFPGKTL